MFCRKIAINKHNSIDDLLEQQGLSIIAVPADDYCLLRAVNIGLGIGLAAKEESLGARTSNDLDISTLRVLINDEILAYLPFYKAFCEDTVDIKSKPNDYLFNGNYNTSVGDLCIAAISNLKIIQLVSFNVRSLPTNLV